MFNRFKFLMKNLSPLIFTKENVPNITAGTVLTFVSSGLNIFMAILFGQAVESLGENKSLTIANIELDPLTLVSLYGVTWTVANLTSYVKNLSFNSIGTRATEKMVERYFDNLMDQPLGQHLTIPMGNHINRIIKCYIALPALNKEMSERLIPTVIEVSLATGLVSKFYGYELGLTLVGLMALYTGFNVASTKRVTKLREIALEKGIACYEGMTSIITNYESVHAFNNLIYEKNKLRTIVNTNSKAETAASAIVYKLALAQTLIAGVGFTALISWVATKVRSGQYTLNDFIVIAPYLAQFSLPLIYCGASINQVLSSVTELGIVFDELAKAPTIRDDYPNVQLRVQNENAKIEFRNVSFHYDPKVPILKNISFTIYPGQKVGIVGVSGAGKSTIGNLLFRFYEPTSGTILINDQDISKVSLHSLRKSIAIIPQTPVLFNDTLYNNIKYGGLCRDPQPTDEEIHKAVRDLSLTHFVNSLPDKLQTNVGEKGAKISGGQRQRLAIMRAMLKHSQIYLCDEATSALDNEVEREIQNKMHEVAEGETVLNITHRLDILKNADSILVLKDGEVAEQGNHAELIKANGCYADLWRKGHKPAAPRDEKQIFSEISKSSPVQFHEYSRSSVSRGLLASHARLFPARDSYEVNIKIDKFEEEQRDSKSGLQKGQQ